MLLCKFCYLSNPGFGNIACINPTNRRPFIMYLEHKLLCTFTIDSKKTLQDFYDKFHRGVIVVK